MSIVISLRFLLFLVLKALGCSSILFEFIEDPKGFKILIVKTAINQTFNQLQLPITSFMLMALGKFHPEYYDFSSLLWIVFLVNSRGFRFSYTATNCLPFSHWENYRIGLIFTVASFRQTFEENLPSSLTTFSSTP